MSPDDWSPPDFVGMDGEDPSDEDEDESSSSSPESGEVVVAVDDQESCDSCDHGEIECWGGKLKLWRVGLGVCWLELSFNLNLNSCSKWKMRFKLNESPRPRKLLNAEL